MLNWGFLHVNVMPIGAAWQTITQLEEHMPRDVGQQMQPRKLAVSKHRYHLESPVNLMHLEVGVASSLHPSPPALILMSHEAALCDIPLTGLKPAVSHF